MRMCGSGTVRFLASPRLSLAGGPCGHGDGYLPGSEKMRVPKLLLLGSLLYLGTLSAPALARVDIGVAIGVPPPPQTVIVPRHRPGFVWVPGYWRWTGYSYLWIRGHWVPHRRGYYWAPPRYSREGHYYRYHRGYWAHERHERRERHDRRDYRRSDHNRRDHRDHRQRDRRH